MIKRVFLAVGAVFAAASVPLPLSAGGYEAESGLCTAQETTFFKARIAGQDTFVSLCGPPGAGRTDSGRADRNPAWLQLRVGNEHGAELVYPRWKHRSLKAFTYRRYTRPRTSYLKLAFEMDGREYAIHESHTPDRTPVSSVSFRVRRVSDKVELSARKLIVGEPSPVLLGLERFLPRKPFDG